MSWLDKMKQGLSKAADEAGDLAEVSKTRMQIRRLEGRKKDLFTEIGEKVFGAYREEEPAANLDPLCGAIQQLEDKIAEKQEEIERIKAATQEVEVTADTDGSEVDRPGLEGDNFEKEPRAGRDSSEESGQRHVDA